MWYERTFLSKCVDGMTLSLYKAKAKVPLPWLIIVEVSDKDLLSNHFLQIDVDAFSARASTHVLGASA